jgi:hypothetical protein
MQPARGSCSASCRDSTDELLRAVASEPPRLDIQGANALIAS